MNAKLYKKNYKILQKSEKRLKMKILKGFKVVLVVFEGL